MIIHWLGESCFLIKQSNGRRILLDPINLSTNKISNLNPSIITLSNNYIYDKINPISTTKKINIINSFGEYQYNNILINGYLSYCDNMNGQKRGENIIYYIETDNIKLCHLGHLGHKLSNEILSKLINIDILFIPIGGHFTINSTEALNIINILKPKYIVPMCYRTSGSSKFLDSPKTFLTSSKNIRIINTDFIDTDVLFSDSNMTTLVIKESLI